MLAPFLTRAGSDTLAKLESAATFRFREANKLRARDEPLGALYLYGYSVEIRLKAAYYRVVGLTPVDLIDRPNTLGQPSPRKHAESQIKLLFPSPSPAIGSAPAAGHDISGWAKLLEYARANPPILRPLSLIFGKTLMSFTDVVADHWREYLRYRANKPTASELKHVYTAARWFSRNRVALWR